MRHEEHRDRPSAVSLFSGAGGLDLAAHSAGFVTVAAIESVARYAQTLSDNAWISHATYTQFSAWFDQQVRTMGKVTREQVALTRERLLPAVGRANAMSSCSVAASDIKDVSPQDLMSQAGLRVGELDLVIGGPPCQSFSMSGQRQSLEDLRGQLFLQFARFVREMQPRWFVFENVKGMTHSSALVVNAACKKCGNFMPSHADVLLDPLASEYLCVRCGSPARVLSRRQDRRGALDVIVNELANLGYDCHVRNLNAIEFGVPQSRERVFIVGTRDGERFRMPSATHSMTADAPPSGECGLWEVENDLLPPATVWQALFSEPNPYHRAGLDPNVALLWVKNVVRPHAEPVTWDLRRPSPTVGSHQAAKLAIAPMGVPEEQIFRQQWHTRGRRQGDTPPVEVEHTYLSDSDLLRLQTFPTSWYVAGTRMERAFQIGNAVPPLLGAAVLGQIGLEADASMPTVEVAS